MESRQKYTSDRKLDNWIRTLHTKPGIRLVSAVTIRHYSALSHVEGQEDLRSRLSGAQGKIIFAVHFGFSKYNQGVDHTDCLEIDVATGVLKHYRSNTDFQHCKAVKMELKFLIESVLRVSLTYLAVDLCSPYDPISYALLPFPFKSFISFSLSYVIQNS